MTSGGYPEGLEKHLKAQQIEMMLNFEKSFSLNFAQIRLRQTVTRFLTVQTVRMHVFSQVLVLRVFDASVR